MSFIQSVYERTVYFYKRIYIYIYIYIRYRYIEFITNIEQFRAFIYEKKLPKWLPNICKINKKMCFYEFRKIIAH